MSKTVLIPLLHGLSTVIDIGDAELAARHHWHVSRTGRKNRPYVTTQIKVGGRRKTERLHRLIMRPPPGFCVDHINGDPLDNRRCNLRISSYAQNVANSPATCRSQSGRKGVWKKTLSRPWCAGITVRGHFKHLGCFATKNEAGAAYDRAARELYGEFAYPSFDAPPPALEQPRAQI